MDEVAYAPLDEDVEIDGAMVVYSKKKNALPVSDKVLSGPRLIQ